MRIIGCDLHAAQQTIAMLDCDSGERIERTLKHEGSVVRDFYASLAPPVVVGIEATGSMGWFRRLMEELGIACPVGHPAKIARSKHAGRNTIAVTRPCCSSCSQKIASRRYGCRPQNSQTCAPCCCIVINGYGCGRA